MTVEYTIFFKLLSLQEVNQNVRTQKNTEKFIFTLQKD